MQNLTISAYSEARGRRVDLFTWSGSALDGLRRAAADARLFGHESDLSNYTARPVGTPHRAPYPGCHTPDKCAGYCRRDIACND